MACVGLKDFFFKYYYFQSTDRSNDEIWRDGIIEIYGEHWEDFFELICELQKIDFEEARDKLMFGLTEGQIGKI